MFAASDVPWMSNPVIQCPLCRRLEAEREESERAYALALRTLDERLETATGAEFSKLRHAEADARLDLEMLRRQLDRHRLEHIERV